MEDATNPRDNKTKAAMVPPPFMLVALCLHITSQGFETGRNEIIP